MPALGPRRPVDAMVWPITDKTRNTRCWDRAINMTTNPPPGRRSERTDVTGLSISRTSPRGHPILRHET